MYWYIASCIITYETIVYNMSKQIESLQGCVLVLIWRYLFSLFITWRCITEVRFIRSSRYSLDKLKIATDLRKKSLETRCTCNSGKHLEYILGKNILETLAEVFWKLIKSKNTIHTQYILHVYRSIYVYRCVRVCVCVVWICVT